MAGVTSTGFDPKTFEDVADELEAAFISAFGATVDLSPTNPFGQIVTILAQREAILWEVAEAVYHSNSRKAAEGSALNSVGSLTGTPRLAAKKSRVTVTLALNATVTVPAGSVVHVAGQPSTRFVLTADVTSVGAGNYPGIFESENYGPIVANAGTLTTIATPVSGWTGATNALDATLGRNFETDTEYRNRQEAEVVRPGAATTDAIRADVLAVAGVLQCNVYENDSDVTDANNIPPHAFETILWDGNPTQADDTEIITAIFGAKPAGIRAHGTTKIAHTDDSSNEIEIGFTRATERTIWLEIDVTTNNQFDVVNGPTAIEDLIVPLGNALAVGDDVVALQLKAACLEITGVTDVPALRLGFASSPTNTANLVMSRSEIARFDSARTSVTVL